MNFFARDIENRLKSFSGKELQRGFDTQIRLVADDAFSVQKPFQIGNSGIGGVELRKRRTDQEDGWTHEAEDNGKYRGKGEREQRSKGLRLFAGGSLHRNTYSREFPLVGELRQKEKQCRPNHRWRSPSRGKALQRLKEGAKGERE